MPLHLYNTLTKQEEEFTPIHPGEVTMYTCGPTVYGRPHIGNYSSFLLADLLRRWLEAGHGYKVTHVKNITDVGHLVADGDEGEDKVEKQAREEFGELTRESVIGIARKYEAQYLADEKELNFLEPAHRPRATDYISHMKEMIDVLLNNGQAYVTDDSIYFNVTAELPTPYGTLSGNKLEDLQAGSRVGVNEQKKHPSDFALWKFCVGANANHVLRWPSPGEGNLEGFPGWHIECSAMSRGLLGDSIDIHTGGEDNIFPHHECEIAQTESVTGKKPFVKLWLHRRRINMGEEKMSKSLGNVLTLDDVKEMGFSAQDLRYYFLSVHYRTQLKLTQKGLEDAHKARRRVVEWIEEINEKFKMKNEKSAHPSAGAYMEKFKSAMDADLNTPEALAVVFKAMADSRNEGNLAAYKSLADVIKTTFGCFEPEDEQDVPQAVQILLDQRDAARMSRDYALSDQLRDQIQELGYEVRDAGNEQIVRKL